MGLFSGKCTSAARLDGKTAIVTGSNTGIGKVTVQDFFERGARVIMACRNIDKAKEAAEDIKKKCEGKQNLGQILTTELDLMSLASVRNCAKYINDNERRIDLLINNAGIMMCPQAKTADGFEIQFGTNHLGHFLLTLLLLPKICHSTPARIVNVSSLAHEMAGPMDFEDLNWERKKYSSLNAYQQSKLCNILFTRELATRLKAAKIEGVNVYSLHPGVIKTDLGRHLSDTYGRGVTWIWNNLISWMIKTPQQGAQTTIYCAVDEKCQNETGLYYSDCAVKAAHSNGQNDEDAKRLWDESVKMVGLENYDPFKQ